MRRTVWLALALPLCGASCRPEEATYVSSEREFGEPKLVVKLKDPAINESSGLARSNRFPGTFYTHNDSGDSARFWRFDVKGKIWGPYNVEGAEAIDWEGASSAKIGDKNYLYFADIGDNGERRTSIQVYRVEEPEIGTKTLRAVKFELRYPMGSYNAEAFMVDPKTEEMFVVSKTTLSRPRLFAFRPESGKATIVGNELGRIDLDGVIDAAKLITGGDISPDGRHLVLRSYVAAHEFAYSSGSRWWESKSYRIKTAPEIQGEAIAYSSDGKRLVTTSEFAPCPVSEIPIQERARRS